MEIIVFLILLSLGYFVGQSIEKSHYKNIIVREAELLHIPVTTDKKTQFDGAGTQGRLFVGNVVISGDYFKLVGSSLRSLVGGQITFYETLADRARREAILRMKAQANNWGAEKVVGLRLETSSVGGKGPSGESKLVSVEVVAYGTGIKQP
ncbi:MAG: heavy metal-binding domain-containing protein [Bacteriovoracaceae bacterium]|jgi:uncharacterized protein YbjQ (UPF0145 family)|nr:heavy metal-binding domain-containing protein [Bacteriovoracaceae bacterium]